MKDMNSLSPLYGAMTGKAPRALAVAGLAALAIAVPAGGLVPVARRAPKGTFTLARTCPAC
jgi:hypothetical protein